MRGGQPLATAIKHHYHGVRYNRHLEKPLLTQNHAALGGGFAAAERFHENFYHNEMQDFEIEIDRPQVHRFVARVLRLLQ